MPSWLLRYWTVTTNTLEAVSLTATSAQGMPVLVTVFTLLIATASAVSAAVGVWLTVKSRRDAQWTRDQDEKARLYELARRLHEDLTTGEVERARSVLGHVVHGKMTIGSEVERRDALDSYFRLLWCFERIHAGQRVITASGSTNAETFFRDLFRWHVDEWRRSIHGKGQLRDMLAVALGEKNLDDDQSIAAFSKVCDYFNDAHTDHDVAGERSPA